MQVIFKWLEKKYNIFLESIFELIFKKKKVFVLTHFKYNLMKVSFNKIIISPKDFIGRPMAGYTRKNPCLGKLDDIYAYGVLIEGTSKQRGKNELLFISLDLLKIPIALCNYIKKKIKEIHPSLEGDQILIHCTHTHSAPDLTGEFYWPGGLLNVMKGIMFGRNRSDDYIVWFVNQIVKMAEDLIKNLIPCKMAWSKKKFNPDIVINRRHPTRQSIPELGVISFINVDNNSLIGFIVNYSCHPTTLSFQNNKLSADYPGKIIEKISQLTNNNIGVIFFNGAAGDINPITTCGTNYQKLELDKSLIYDQLGTYNHTKKIGYTIAEEALNLTKSIPKKDYYCPDCKIPLKKEYIEKIIREKIPKDKKNSFKPFLFAFDMFFWLSCITYPYDIFPSLIQTFINLNPLYYIFDILRLTWLENNVIITISTHFSHFCVLLSLVIIIPLVGVYIFNLIYDKNFVK